MSTVTAKMDRKYYVMRKVVPDTALENSREFMKWAAHALAKEMIANGCVRYTSQFDIREVKTTEVFTIMCGFPETRRLP